MNKLLIIALLTFVIASCQRSPLKVNTSNIDISLSVRHYSDDLFSAANNLENQLDQLEKDYKDFFAIFNHQMIRIGSKDSSDFLPQLHSFLKDSVIIEAKKLADEKIDKVQLEKDFLSAFKYYKYHFPEETIPDIYTCISGFNQSIVVTESLIGVSLDKYLGEDCEYYPMLGIANYKMKNMHPGKIVPDAMYAWMLTEYPIKSDADRLIDYMIYKGKLMYYLDAMMPDLDDTVKIGYSSKQLNFCELSEQGMWTYLAEQKMLFSTKRMDIKRYVDDGPYTSSFTSDSPGRTGVWLGWQIVKAYMKKNPDVSLKALMEDEDYLGILNRSGYQPG